MAACASVSRVAAACSPYAVFRASDRVWARAWALAPSLAPPAAAQPVVAPPKALSQSRPRRRRDAAAVIQGELFGLPPGLPQSTSRRKSSR